MLALHWRRPGLFLYVLVADAVADLLAAGLKDVTNRPRPPVRYPEQHPLVHLPHDGSFPSGHAATSFACASVLSRVAPRLSVPLFALAIAIAFSRVYNAVHYPLDVLGGAVLGVLTALLLLRAGRRRWSRAQRSG